MITDEQIKNMTLIEYIRALNKITEDWVAEKPEERWGGLLTEDLDHWHEYGITTAWDLAQSFDDEEVDY